MADGRWGRAKGRTWNSVGGLRQTGTTESRFPNSEPRIPSPESQAAKDGWKAEGGTEKLNQRINGESGHRSIESSRERVA